MFPVLAILAFGLIEFGLVLKDYLTVANMTRAGARTSRRRRCQADGRLQDPPVDQWSRQRPSAAATSSTSWSSRPRPGSSALPSVSCQTGSVTGLCNLHAEPNSTLAKTNFGTCVSNGDATVDGAWCPLKRVNTLTGNGGTGPDFVGVYIKTVHPYVTNLFGNALTLSRTRR